MSLENKLRFRSRFFQKDALRDKENWMNEQFRKGYALIELQEVKTGYFVHMVYDPHHPVQSRVRFFFHGMEETMDEWILSKYEDGWEPHVHATDESYWVIIHKRDPDRLPPIPQLFVGQLMDLWWLWFIAALVFGLLFFTGQ
jgi:hypothetical protein